MAARKTANPYAARLAHGAKTIAKARAEKLHAPLFDVFIVVAAAGDARRASGVLDWMYGPRVPAPTAIATALSTSAIDGFCAASGLGDRTRGLPTRDGAPSGSLAERVAKGEAIVRDRMIANAYAGEPPSNDAWQKKAMDDPWRRIDQWRRIQRVVQKDERDALARVDAYLDHLAVDVRGAGQGVELVLALDLALRNGEAARVPAWLACHGHRFASESFLIETALCLPAVAAAIAHGALRETVGLSDAEIDDALRAVDAAIDTSTRAKRPTAPKVQRRRVACEYSQVHLQPATLDDAEKQQVYFQEQGDSERGMSLFPTMVGIGTPTETDYVDAEVSVSPRPPPARALKTGAQAVAFPFLVRGPLVLTSVSSADGEPLIVTPGTYDVLARFIAKKAPRVSASAGLRIFTLALSFHPAGTLGAPRTLRLEA